MAVRRSFVICCSNSLGVTPNWRLNISIPKPSVILPAIFTVNYFTLRPGETKTVEIEVDSALLEKGYQVVVKTYQSK